MLRKLQSIQLCLKRDIFSMTYLGLDFQNQRKQYLKQFKSYNEMLQERNAVQLQMKKTNYNIDSIQKMSYLVKNVTDLKFLFDRIDSYIKESTDRKNHILAKSIGANICYHRRDAVTAKKWNHIWFDADTESDNKAITKILSLLYDKEEYAQVQNLYNQLQEPHIDHHLVFTAASFKLGTPQDFANLWNLRQNKADYNGVVRSDSILSLFAIELGEPGIALDIVRSYLHNSRVPPVIRLNLILYCHLKNHRIEDAVDFIKRLIKITDPTTTITITEDNWKMIEDQDSKSFRDEFAIHLNQRIFIEKSMVPELILRPITKAEALAAHRKNNEIKMEVI